MPAIWKHNKGETYEPGMSIRWPKLASWKLDGIRVSGQNNTLITNSGKEIPNKALIEKFAPQIQGLDGELIFGDANDPDVYNKTFSAVMRKTACVADGVSFHVFDRLHATLPFVDRLALLNAGEYASDICLVLQRYINSDDELARYYENALELGYEGVILRNHSALYKQGRSTLASQDLLKWKPLADAEFTVGEMYEAQHNGNVATIDAHGHTQRSSHAENKVGNGMLGGFRALWNGMPFSIAPGRLSHAERIHIWENQHLYRGRVGVFTYMTHGIVDVPRHPRFKGWRDKIDLD